MRFHREVSKPEFEELLDSKISHLHGEMLALSDGVYKRFDRLEDEYQALRAAVARLEERATRIEARLDAIEKHLAGMDERYALRVELEELKSEVARIEQRLAELDAHS